MANAHSASPAQTRPMPIATAAPNSAEIRPFPYPFRAMLAICSDLDETPDARAYAQIMRYLNTRDDLGWSQGVGLEVGNTLYFDMPPDQFAYWNTDDPGRAMARDLMLSGHIDCLHSYGDLAATRAHAERAQDELARHGLRIEVWVDHAVAPTNLGADIMRGSGDVPGAPAYHADLTVARGVQYVWRGRVTSVIGQDRPISLGGLLTPAHPLASARTWLKEALKVRRARRGDVKYAMHGSNELVRPVQLRDGQVAWEFMRCNPHWGGVSAADTAAGIAEVLTPRFLDRLVDRGGIGILYTHLGKTRNPAEPFDATARRAWERLGGYVAGGKILVTTTRRLLGYRQMRTHAIVSVQSGGQPVAVQAMTSDSARVRLAPSDWQGLTVYAESPREAHAEVTVEGKAAACPPWSRSLVAASSETQGEATGSELRRCFRAQVNPPDETGRTSISIPWTRLEFPA